MSWQIASWLNEAILTPPLERVCTFLSTSFVDLRRHFLGLLQGGSAHKNSNYIQKRQPYPEKDLNP
jgi:hypothetical protein